MKNTLIIFVLALSFQPAISQACATAATDYLVYSRGDIQYQNSDFQGITGAGGNIQLQSFEVRNSVVNLQCATLIGGGWISVTDAGIENGGIDGGSDIYLERVHVKGTVNAYGKITTKNSNVKQKKNNVASHAVAGLNPTSYFFLQSSANFSQWPTTHTAKDLNSIGHVQYAGVSGQYAVYNQTTAEFEKGRLLSLNGPKDSFIIINVRGPVARIDHQDIRLEGGIGFGQVLINFVDATTLHITKSGESSYGIPASILAPYAATTFVDGLITGGLYVGSLCGDGQVNPGKFFAWQPLTPLAPPPLKCQAPFGSALVSCP